MQDEAQCDVYYTRYRVSYLLLHIQFGPKSSDNQTKT